MAQNGWDIKELLAVGENVTYQCELKTEYQDDDGNPATLVDSIYVTNYRIIVINDNDNGIATRFVKFIDFCNIHGEYSARHDQAWGTGKYGVLFGTTNDYWVFWFYSKEVCKTFYRELCRSIVEE